jgi:hypothetical protein
VLVTLGFVVSEPLAGTPFRCRRLVIENFVSLAGEVGRISEWRSQAILASDIVPETLEECLGLLSETPFQSKFLFLAKGSPQFASNRGDNFD